jgi:hypothetical protein
MQWKHTNSPRPRKAKTTFSPGKIMASIFWDSKGIIYVDFLTGLKTIIAQYYSTLVTEKVKPAICSKRRKPQDSLCFLQDNARPNVGDTMETEVGCTASSTIQS